MTEPVTIGRATKIYALCDEGGVVRYVGKTVRTLKDRFGQHRRAALRGNLPVNRWLLKHSDASIRLLEIVSAGEDWAERERYWINAHKNLLNLTEGGEGLSGHSFTQEHKDKIAAALRTGAEFACETCGVVFWRKRHEIKNGECRFCSRDCYAKSLKGVSRPMPRSAVTRGVAAAAALRRSRTHCKRSHPLSGNNLFITSQGGRSCKECRKIHKANYRRKFNG